MKKINVSKEALKGLEKLLMSGLKPDKKEIKMLMDKITEEDFMSNKIILTYAKLEILVPIIKSFKNPDWFTLVKYKSTNSPKDLVNALNKENIDFSMIKDGKTLVGLIFEGMTKTTPYLNSEYLNIIKLIDSNTIIKEFLINPDTHLFNLVATQNTSIFIKHLSSILDTPEVRVSDNYKKLFNESSFITDYLLNKKIETLKEILEENKGFISDDKANVLISTKLLKSIFSSSSLESDTFKSFEEMMDSKTFKPKVSLLNEDYVKAVSRGNVTPDKIGILKRLISEGVLSSEKMNNPDEGSPTTYELHLKKGLYKIITSDNKVEEIEKLIKNLNALEEIGIKPYLSFHSKDELKKEVDGSFKTKKYHNEFYGSGDINKDLMDLSMDLRIPPFMIEKLVDFFDKRYAPNLSEENILRKEKALEKEKELKDSLDALIDRTIEINPLSSNKKVKP